MLHLLDTNGVIPSNSPNERVWKDGQSMGDFSVKKCYNWLITRNRTQVNLMECVHPKRLWSKFWPAKVIFFLWVAIKHKILTQDQLNKRKWKRIWVNHCYMCIKDEETPLHLLLHCQLASHTWNFFREEFQLIWVLPNSIATALCTWPCPATKTRKSLVIKALPAAILWSLWKERNHRVFDNKSLTAAKLIQKIRHTIHSGSIFNPISGIQLLKNSCSTGRMWSLNHLESSI